MLGVVSQQCCVRLHGAQDDLIGPWSRARIPLSNGLMDGTHPSVHSDYKALSAKSEAFLFLLKIKRNDWTTKLKRRLDQPGKALPDRTSI